MCERCGLILNSDPHPDQKVNMYKVRDWLSEIWKGQQAQMKLLEYLSKKDGSLCHGATSRSCSSPNSDVDVVVKEHNKKAGSRAGEPSEYASSTFLFENSGTVTNKIPKSLGKEKTSVERLTRKVSINLCSSQLGRMEDKQQQLEKATYRSLKKIYKNLEWSAPGQNDDSKARKPAGDKPCKIRSKTTPVTQSQMLLSPKELTKSKSSLWKQKSNPEKEVPKRSINEPRPGYEKRMKEILGEKRVVKHEPVVGINVGRRSSISTDQSIFSIQDLSTEL